MEVWVVSDTHYGHESVCTKFKNADGTPLRPFSCAEEMNEWMVDAWNAKVRPDDRVIHLGDVVINKKHLPILDRLNGVKELVIGNHDIHHLDKLAPYFTSMTGMKVKGDLIMTHVPIHHDCIERFGANVHGHLHEKQIMIKNTWDAGYHDHNGKWIEDWDTESHVDSRYLNVSCEHTNFQPITLDEVKARVKTRQAEAGYTPPVAWGNGSGPA